MEESLRVEILPQPTDSTCGPTCLHAVYRYFGDEMDLDDVIAQVRSVEGGGTLAVLLGLHALGRGYRGTIYTYNLQVFDPTWFAGGVDLRERLAEQARHKPSPRLRFAAEAYGEFIARGGRIRFEDLTAALVRRHLNRGRPILTGLSATYLYLCSREVAEEEVYDDVRGEPVGHFVVLSGYDAATRTVRVADPYKPNPVARSRYYSVPISRLVGAILLGIVTYDANLLVLEPPRRLAGARGRADPPSR